MDEMDFSEAVKLLERLGNGFDDKTIRELAAKYEDAFGHSLEIDSVKAGVFVALDILDRVTTWRNPPNN